MLLKSLTLGKLIRQFFFGIDKIFYNWIGELYNLLVTLARVSPLSQADIVDISNRIYRLLAIFMIFKVTFSLIMYVVNPDDFSDKSKGWGKLTSNIIISLSLLILTPYIFNMAYRLQAIILEDNSIAALVFGEDAEQGFFNTAGEQMAFIAMSPFMTPDLSQFPACSVLTTYEDGVILFNEDCSGLSNEDLTGLSDKGSNTLYSQTKKNGGRKGNDKFPEIALKNYVTGVKNKNMGLAFREDIVTAINNEDEAFVMDYSYMFSTGVAVLIVLMLISFCLDIATRSMKLAFYQLVAPIPIISLVDPKSGKDGMFKKWYKACFSTYLSLFIRLLAIYFAVFIISKLQNLRLYDSIDQTFITNKVALLFIMLGALMFAKQLPKILENLGIKLDGGGKFYLNPLKKLDEEAVGFKKGRKLLGGLAAAGAVGVAAGATNLATGIAGARGKWKGKNWKETGKNILKNAGSIVGSGIGGAAGGLRRGIQGTAKGEKMFKNFSNSYSGAMKAKKARDDRDAMGVKWYETMGYNIAKKTGMSTTEEGIKANVKRVEEGKIRGNHELEEGLKQSLIRKYGTDVGKRKFDAFLKEEDTGGVRNAKNYLDRSSKELEDMKKIQESQKKSISTVAGAKKSIEGLASGKSAVKKAQARYDSVRSRTDADYISGLYDGDSAKLQKAVTREKERIAREEARTGRTLTDEEKEERLRNARQKVYAPIKADIEKSYKDEVDRETRRAITDDLADDKSGAQQQVLTMLDDIKQAVDSSSDDRNDPLREAFDEITKDCYVDAEKTHFDASKITDDKLSEILDAFSERSIPKAPEKPADKPPKAPERADFSPDSAGDIAYADALQEYKYDLEDYEEAKKAYEDYNDPDTGAKAKAEKKGKVYDAAKRAEMSRDEIVANIEDMLAARASETTELQNSDEAKKAQDIASAAGSSGSK